MIDWFSGSVGYNGSALKLDRICELTPEGEVRWTIEKKMQARGSYDASIQIGRTAPTDEMLKAAKNLNLLVNPECLQISGNPSKFLQGHNVFGPSVSALGPVIQATVRGLPESIRPSDADSPLWPAVHRSRVDITTSIDLKDHRLVHEWLRTAGMNTRSRHGRAMVSGDTVYWGQHSRRWTLKAYCKFCELDVHPAEDRQLVDSLKDFCHDHLRIELTLRTLELKPRATLEESLIWDYMSRLEIGVMKAEEGSENIKPKLKFPVECTLKAWLAGEDVRQSMPRRTFYLYRRKILDEVGVDISLSPDVKTVKRINFDLDYLKKHEVKEIPSDLQQRLFKPGDYPKYSKNGY